MWQLQNRTPFAAERGWVRDRDGTEIWLVAVKASFTLQTDGTLRVAEAQPEVLRGPAHRGDAASTSLRADADLVRTKVATDVIVDGQAHAPGGTPVTELDVGLAVGSRTKVLKVFGDRVWQGRSIGRPAPFTAMPIVWERAFGGVDPQADPATWDERNPPGQGYAVEGDHVNGRPLPNIEDPDHLIRSWKDRPVPAGFGALCSHWTERRRFAGTYDERWQRERLPLLPDDFDDRHYQCAPPDQQHAGFLRGGEPVALLNLSPGGGQLRFALPRVFLGLETFFNDGHREVHPPPKLHTVILAPDERRVSLVFHSALPCHPRVLKLQHTRIWLKQDLRDGVLGAPEPDSAEVDGHRAEAA
nr:DUF2169 domain-containing protein [uncultured Roseateles sp.]